MANFAAYQSRGQLAAPEVHFTKPVGVSYDNPGERALARVNADTAGVIVKGYENWKEQYDSGKVMEANNEYNRLMSEGTAELMQKKQENALNIVQDYDKLHQKALDQVRKKFGAFINYGKAGQAFNIYTERDNNTRRNNMMKYQLAETEAYHETQFNNQVLDCRQSVLDGGSSDEAINGGLNRLASLIQDRYGDYGKEKMVEQQIAMGGQIVGGAIASAISMGDYDRAGQILTKYRQYVSPKVYIETMERVHKQQEIKKDYMTVDDITSQCRDANGVIDLSRAKAVLEKLYGPEAVTQGGGVLENANANAIYQRFKEAGYSDTAIAGILGRVQQEHNFNTSNVEEYDDPETGLHLGGYGMFQWNGSRTTRFLNWAQEAGLNPQDASTQAEFALIEAEERGLTPEVMNKLSHTEAATKWTDDWEVGEHGNEHKYAAEWLEKIQQPASAFNPEKLEKLMKMVEHVANEERARDLQESRSIGISLREAARNGTANLNELADQLASGKSKAVQLEAQDLADTLITARQKAAERAAKGQPSGKVSEADKNFLRAELTKGEVTETQILDYCTENGITSNEEINKLLKIQKEYMENKGEFAIDYDYIEERCGIDIKHFSNKESFEKAIKKVAQWEYKVMRAESNGRLQDGWEDALAKRVADDMTKYVVGGTYTDKGWFFDTEEQTKIPVRALLSNGFRPEWEQTGDDGYILYTQDGQAVYKTGAEIRNMADRFGYIE